MSLALEGTSGYQLPFKRYFFPVRRAKRMSPDIQDMLRRVAAPSPITAKMLKDIRPSPIVELAEGSFASKFYNYLGEMIQEFDENLDDEHEVGARLVSFGQAIVFHILGIGFQNPSLIIFHGRAEDGSPVQLIQHVSQISVLLTSVPKQDPNKPKHKFGFQHYTE